MFHGYIFHEHSCGSHTTHIHTLFLSLFVSVYVWFCHWVLSWSLPGREIGLKFWNTAWRASPRRGGSRGLLFSIIKSQVPVGLRMAKAPIKTVLKARRPTTKRASVCFLIFWNDAEQYSFYHQLLAEARLQAGLRQFPPEPPITHSTHKNCSKSMRAHAEAGLRLFLNHLESCSFGLKHWRWSFLREHAFDCFKHS